MPVKIVHAEPGGNRRRACSVDFVALLRDCAMEEDLRGGKIVHLEILQRGLIVKDHRVGTALLHMYSKCGELAEAQRVLHALPYHDVVTWNAFITGLAQHRKGVEALMFFQQMQFEGIHANTVTFMCILKACGSIEAVNEGQQVHNEIVRKGLLRKDLALCNALVGMYVSCGELIEARYVLNNVHNRDTVTWSTLIAGYVREGHDDEALNCFRQMQKEGLFPDAVTYTSILNACSRTGSMETGQEIHHEVVVLGLFEKDAKLGNALIDMYARFGDVIEAQKLFCKLSLQSIVSWTALISGYAEQRRGEQAFNSFKKMQQEGMPPNVITYVCVMKACSRSGSVDMGKQIHHQITYKGLSGMNLVLSNVTVNMYATCGLLTEAQKEFDMLAVRDIVSWNALISGYILHNQSEKVFYCLTQMRNERLSPTSVTYLYALKACASMHALDTGEQIHDTILNNGFLQKHCSLLGSALMEMYTRCGALSKAERLLHELHVHDVVLWNALISAYAESGGAEKALNGFVHMQTEGHSPDAVTFASVLKACGIIGAADEGRRIHTLVIMKGLLGKFAPISTALVDMYARCGAFADSQKMLDSITVQDSVSWNALISGYALQGLRKDALHCFEQMQRGGVSADIITFTCILRACAATSSVNESEKIHDEIISRGFLEDMLLGTALVDMYARCGALVQAEAVLEKLPVRDVISWSVLIAGYARQGHGKEALYCFERMQNEGLSPNAVTFISVLNACSHSGLVDEGETCLMNMGTCGVIPNLEHCICMVDLLGRAGRLLTAMGIIEKMPSSYSTPVWGTLLGACRKWGNVRLGRLAFEQLVLLDDLNVLAYACMATIYGAAGMYDNAKQIEAMRVNAFVSSGRRTKMET